MPIGHLGINVADLDASKTYYDELMPMVSFEPFKHDEGQFSYRPRDGKIGTWLFFYRALEQGDFSRHRPGFQHLAFYVKTRAEVHGLHEWALAKGDEIVHAPREFPEYHSSYYATFWLDPNGFMLEVLCPYE